MKKEHDSFFETGFRSGFDMVFILCQVLSYLTLSVDILGRSCEDWMHRFLSGHSFTRHLISESTEEKLQTPPSPYPFSHFPVLLTVYMPAPGNFGFDDLFDVVLCVFCSVLVCSQANYLPTYPTLPLLSSPLPYFVLLCLPFVRSFMSDD